MNYDNDDPPPPYTLIDENNIPPELPPRRNNVFRPSIPPRTNQTYNYINPIYQMDLFPPSLPPRPNKLDDNEMNKYIHHLTSLKKFRVYESLSYGSALFNKKGWFNTSKELAINLFHSDKGNNHKSSIKKGRKKRRNLF